MNKMLEKILNEKQEEQRPIPFWSWNNSLDESVLVAQIENMKSEGIGGFIMHARTGLLDEYLGEKWFSCISACLKKAKELNMKAWIYDENGWPSGFVGGKLLEKNEFRARFLEYSKGGFDTEAYAVFSESEEAGYIRVDAPTDGCNIYHNIYMRLSPANTDILNPDVVDAFIAETHEKYYERFSDSFGAELAGFFTDEPQFYRYDTPYTPELEKYISNVRDGLIWLFVNDRRGYSFRREYYGTLNRLYTNNFYKKVYDWCDGHGCKLTGHSIEEGSLYQQMWGGAAVMPSYEFEHIPAIDALGRRDVGELATRQVASVAAQLGKKQVLTETFACCGYDVTPRELRSIAESQFFGGVNLLCHHLYPYSIAAQGKTDHPPVFGPSANWGDAFRGFNDYFSRLGALIAATEDVVDIAIIHPMHSIWLNYIRQVDFESVRAEEEGFCELLFTLRKNGITYHFIDESILAAHGENKNGCLAVGNMQYKTLLLPKMESIDRSTYNLLSSFEGRLCVLGNPKYIDGVPADINIKPNITPEQLFASAAVKYKCNDAQSFITHRKGECGEFLFIKNLSHKEASEVLLEGAEKSFCRLDLMTGEEKNISDSIHLEPCEGIILVSSSPRACALPIVTERDVTKDFRVTNISENYLVLDRVSLSRGDGFDVQKPVPCVFEELLRDDFRGKISLKHTFSVKEKIPLSLIMEKANLLSAELNGNPVSFVKSDIDINFSEADITEFVRVGENEFVYSIDFWQHDGVHFALFDPLATESLRNCLYYDTSVENVYIKGDFIVNPDMSIEKRVGLPRLTGSLNKEGYPFFMGTVSIEGDVEYDGEGRAELALEGRFLVAEVFVNGRNADFGIESERDITSCLNSGMNNIKIVLRSSLRNFFGPHHYAPVAEPMGVSPYNFTMRGSWEGGRSPDYTDRYNTVDFGISLVSLRKIK